ncbi:MAG: cytoplasmic protein [Desulfamplus sp.]|nr:cytoplasmic protein [Desulfamplus sp.]
MDRKTDEETLMFYLQKFSEDTFMKAFIPRLNDEDLEQIYNTINFFLKKYFSEDDYHAIFLKDR